MTIISRTVPGILEWIDHKLTYLSIEKAKYKAGMITEPKRGWSTGFLQVCDHIRSLQDIKKALEKKGKLCKT